MLFPKKLKHRKHFRGRSSGIASRGTSLDFGDFGLKALESGRLTSRQIEAARRAITRYVKRGGKIWIRVFPDRVMTKTPDETGMGGGKGSPDHFEATVHRGRILFEISGVSEATAREAMRLAAFKLPLKTTFIKKSEQQE